jgi:hypothetical protein
MCKLACATEFGSHDCCFFRTTPTLPGATNAIAAECGEESAPGLVAKVMHYLFGAGSSSCLVRKGDDTLIFGSTGTEGNLGMWVDPPD